MRQQLLHSLTAVLCLCVSADCLASDWQPLKVDVQGDAHYSRYNFTDVKRPYDGVDGWMELRLALWPEPNRTGFSPYVTVIPTITTESEFWWQRNCSGAFGIQWYPIDKEKDELEWLKNLRLYTTYGVRGYYDKPPHENPEDEDFRIGFDYYKDNLFDEKTFTYFIWTNLTHRSTNYSLSDYSAVLWEGNIKLGPKPKVWVNSDNKGNKSSSIFLPYGLIDWTYVPAHSDRWWENFLRVGAGISFYPKVPDKIREGFKGVLDRSQERFRIYAEVLHNASWLGDNAPGNVKETDWRIGINFSTFWGD